LSIFLSGHFSKELNLFFEKQNALTLSQISLIFAHQEFYGCNYGITQSIHGDRWPIDYPMVVSGHIHQHQKLNNITYVGIPIQQSFYDAPDKTVSIFSFQSNEWTEKRVCLDLPKKILKYLTVEQALQYQPPKNKDLVKIVVQCKKSEIRQLERSKYIQKLLNDGIQIVYKNVSIEHSDKPLNRHIDKLDNERLDKSLKEKVQMVINENQNNKDINIEKLNFWFQNVFS
jgi:hypothetical protein